MGGSTGSPMGNLINGGGSVLQIYDLPTPALIVDRNKLKDNLERMAQMAAAAGVKLRPHIKTHKSPFIAHWQQALGAEGDGGHSG